MRSNPVTSVSGSPAAQSRLSHSGCAYMTGEAPFSPRGPRLVLDTMRMGAGGPPNPVLLGQAGQRDRSRDDHSDPNHLCHNVSHDEFIRDDTTLGLLAALPCPPSPGRPTWAIPHRCPT